MSKKKSADFPPGDPQRLDFEESLARLEELAARLEEGNLGLGDSLACYEEAVKHLAGCHALLDRAEQRIELLAGVDAEGNPLTEPFDEAPESLEEKAPSRGRRRSRREDAASIRPAQPVVQDVDEEDLLF